MPSFSPHVLAGSRRSANAQVSVLAKASWTTTNSAFARARCTSAWSGIDCAGLVQAIHTALISPLSSALNRSTALRPGSAGTESMPHSRATSARSSAAVMSRWPGSRLARPPTSRPPIAFGCPVSDSGPAPGRPIWAVARWRLISAELLWLPKRYWFSPWQYIDRVASAPANHSAACSMSLAGMPQMLAAIVGVYSRTTRLTASKPSVWFAM